MAMEKFFCNSVVIALFVAVTSLLPTSFAEVKHDFKIVTTAAKIHSPLTSSARKPALIYYAVDSSEPFMQLAIDAEIKQLEASCRAGTQTNWIIVLNSSISKGERLRACIQGNQKRVQLKIEDLATKLDVISNPVIQGQYPDQDVLKFPVISTAENAKYFPLYKQYPLVHPQILFDVLAAIGTQVFAAQNHDFFLHLKAHGSPGLALTSLSSDWSAEKIKDQEAAWNALTEKLGMSDVDLATVSSGEFGKKPLLSEKLAQAAGFGPVAIKTAKKTEADAKRLPLEPNGLGKRFHLGLPSIEKPETYFGLPVESLEHVFSELNNLPSFAREEEPSFGFVFFESCQSDVENRTVLTLFIESSLRSLGGYYTAVGSLWYRNVDWDEIFTQLHQPAAAISSEPLEHTASDSSARLQYLLKVHTTSQVANYVAI